MIKTSVFIRLYPTWQKLILSRSCVFCPNIQYIHLIHLRSHLLAILEHVFHFELEGHPHAGIFLAWATRIFLLVSLILVSSYFILQCFDIESSKRLINRRLEIWDLEFVKSCGECLTMLPFNFAYLVFAKQMAKVKRSFLCIRFGKTKIGLNVNLFHVIGPTSGSVSTVLFTPWPIGIVNITLSLKLCTY